MPEPPQTGAPRRLPFLATPEGGRSLAGISVGQPAQRSDLLAAIEGTEVYGRLALHVRLQGDQAASLAQALGQYGPKYIQMFERVLGNGRKYAGIRAALCPAAAWESEAASLDGLVRALFAPFLAGSSWSERRVD